MVTKLKKDTAGARAAPNLSGSVKDSAQQIWQAGLGAFAKAQAEGTRAFEALVKEGTVLQRKTQAAAEERISEATNRMTNMATDISSKASGHWDKLENIFEERVAKALNKLGVPSAKDINALIERIDDLNKSVQKLSQSAPAKAGPAPRKAASGKAASGKAAPRKTASDKPAAVKPASDMPVSDMPASSKPASNKPAADKPAAVKRAAARKAPAAEADKAAARPAAKRSAARKSAA